MADPVSDASSNPRIGGLALSYVMLLGAAAVFGLMPSLNRLAVTNGVPPIDSAFWYAATGVGFATVACLLTRRRPGHSVAHIRTYLLMGGFGLALPMVTLNFVAPHIPASVVALIIALTPAMTYFYALFLRLDRLNPSSLLGLVAGFAGVAVLAIFGGSESQANTVAWLLIALAAPAMFGLANVYAAKFAPPASPPLTLALGQMAGGAVLLAPVVFFSGSVYRPGSSGFGTGEVSILLGGLVIVTLITLFYEIVRREGPVFFSQFTYLNVVTGVLWAVLIFAESLTVIFGAALALMALGLVLVNRGSAKADAS